MPSPDILDFQSLLAPISGENPAGQQLRRGDRAYDEVRDAADRARSAEKKLLYEGGVDSHGQQTTPADWGSILKLAPKTLAQQSKDLRLVAALIEALVRVKGFAGLRDGFRLVRELVSTYWDTLHPLPDEDGIATRVAPLTYLNGEEGKGTLPDPILRIPISEGKSVGPFSTADYRDAAALEMVSDPEKRARREEEPGVVTMQAFQSAVHETSPRFFSALLEDITQCREEFAELGRTLEQRCGKDADGYPLAPPSAAIREALETCFDVASKISRNVVGPPATVEVADKTVVSADENPDGALTVPAGGDFRGTVRSREEAFRALLRVAEYFKQTEPHSPVSYALEQAVRWGRMSLPDLLADLVPEEPLRQQMFKRMGIPTDAGTST
jgi:type VI secretion system protein ImpA